MISRDVFAGKGAVHVAARAGGGPRASCSRVIPVVGGELDMSRPESTAWMAAGARVRPKRGRRRGEDMKLDMEPNMQLYRVVQVARARLYTLAHV